MSSATNPTSEFIYKIQKKTVYIISVFQARVASPLVPCSFLPKQFLQCAEPHDHKGNETTFTKLGHGCLRYGGQRWEEVAVSAACCRVLDCIECSGPRTFLRDGFPCIRYTNHYFVTTLLYSILLGFLGLDRY